MPGAIRAKLVRLALIRLYDVGVLIVNITCDGPNVNLAMLEELGKLSDLYPLKFSRTVS
jgi:hypothetical protein